MKYFTKKMTMEEVKAAYRTAALKPHPDVGGSNEAMQELNAEFKIAFALAKNASKKAENNEINQTADSFCRTFYTQNGWQGSRYNRNLATKDIAKNIRDYVKAVYPNYKFSVTTESFSGGSAIEVALMETPVELTNKERMREWFYKDCHLVYCYVPSKGRVERGDMTESEIEEFIAYRLEDCLSTQTVKDSDTWINPVVRSVLDDVKALMNSYNYDDSDSMIDYFDVNFYGSIGIGKDLKPVAFVPKTERISPVNEVKGAKRLTA